jgi:hypothetical protein
MDDFVGQLSAPRTVTLRRMDQLYIVTHDPKRTPRSRTFDFWVLLLCVRSRKQSNCSARQAPRLRSSPMPEMGSSTDGAVRPPFISKVLVRWCHKSCGRVWSATWKHALTMANNSQPDLNQPEDAIMPSKHLYSPQRPPTRAKLRPLFAITVSSLILLPVGAASPQTTTSSNGATATSRCLTIRPSRR